MQQEERSKDILLIFDVDGTLTKPRNPIEPSMVQTLVRLQKKHYLAVVGGSDIHKIQEQLGKDCKKQLNILKVAMSFDYTFSENGLLSYKKGIEFHRKNLANQLGEENLQKFINFTLLQLSQINIPVKRGTFIEYRNGMINISPIGRNCSQSERDEFERYDHEHNIRKNLIQKLQMEFSALNFKYSIGGQISFDVFPNGWDKTYCLQFLDEFKEIHFFGDKTFEGGNDYEIFTHPRTVGHSVKTFQDTIEELKKFE